MVKRLVGTVSHYYSKAGVAVIQLASHVKIGDKVSFEGPSTDLVQNVDSLQIDGVPVMSADAGREVAMKVSAPVRQKDNLYLEPE
jgi:hypothetical protein